MRPVLLAGLLLYAAAPLFSDSAYFQRSLFDNSLTPGTYFYSQAKALTPSVLEMANGKLPVDTTRFRTPPNALRIAWTSQANGGWEAEIHVPEWRNRDIFFPGTTLQFSVWSDEVILAANLPLLTLRDHGHNFSRRVHWSPKDIPAHQWVDVRVALSTFETASIHPFDPRRTAALVFSQGVPDARPHILIVDEIRIGSTTPAIPPQTPLHLEAKGYERHVDLSWSIPGSTDEPERVIIYRSLDGAKFEPIGTQIRGIHRYEDWLSAPGKHAAYYITASARDFLESKPSATVQAATHGMTDEELLTMVQEASFRYFWEGGGHPVAGMALENTLGDDRIVAVGASGFGIMALLVGVDRGFVTRQQGLERLRQILTFLERADRYHGAWPHFLDGTTGKRMPVFDMYDNGADLVETSFLLQGLLAARQYFHEDQQVFRRITKLWEEVDWTFFQRTPEGTALYWHWSPEYTWYINHPLHGWNEVMITYLLALASLSHPVPARLYDTGWAGEDLRAGMERSCPLFFTHYSYLGCDPHALHDRYAQYFELNQSIARRNYDYCRKHQYPRDVWGITAVDGPQGYVPYEPNPSLDDGTVAPTGALSSMPYTPELSLAALKTFYRDHGSELWDVYGFRDAFNTRQDWVARIYMGLNESPIAVMIENYRTGLVWRMFQANPEIQQLLRNDQLFKP